MRLLRCLLIVTLSLFATHELRAQGALERLEQQLRDETVDPRAAEQPPVDTEPGYLGVVADDRGEEGRGVRVIDVIPGGPAFAGGLRSDDVITGITNRPVRSLADLARLLEHVAAGSEVIFQIIRQGEPQELRVTLGERPDEDERMFERFGPIGEPDAALGSSPRPLLGVKALPIDPATHAEFELPTRGGARIVEVTPGSPASQADVPVEAIVVAVDGLEVRSPADLSLLVRKAGPGAEIELAFYFRGELMRRTVRLAGPREELPPLDEPAATEAEKPRIEQPSRLEALEEQVATMQQRIEELEQMLRRLTDAAIQEGELSP